MAKRDEESAGPQRTRQERTSGRAHLATPPPRVVTMTVPPDTTNTDQASAAILAEIAALRAAHAETQATLLAELAAVRTELSALRTHINQQASLTRRHDTGRLRGLSQQLGVLTIAIGQQRQDPVGTTEIVTPQRPWWRRWLTWTWL